MKVTAQLSKASGQYNNGVISFLLHGEDGSNLQATRVVEDPVHHHNVSSPEFCCAGLLHALAQQYFGRLQQPIMPSSNSYTLMLPKLLTYDPGKSFDLI